MRSLLAVFTLAMAVLADEPRLVIDSGGHQSLIRFIAFTHDGKYLVSAGDDKVIRIWDVAAGKTVRTIRGQIGEGNEGKIFAAALSPDERFLAVGGWLAGSPDFEIIRIYDFQTGDVVGPPLKGHTDIVGSLAFSSDGRYLASGSDDNSVRVWEMATHKLIHTLTGHQEAVYAVAFSPDGRRIVSGSDDKTLRLWDATSGTLLKELNGHTNQVKSVLFSPDGRYIVSGGRDRSIRLWDGRTGEFMKQLVAQGSDVFGLSFSPDGHRLLVGAGPGDDVCHIFEFPSGREISRFSEHDNVAIASAFSPDGTLVATAGGNQFEMYTWNPSNGKLFRRLVGAGNTVWSVAFAKDGRSVAFGTIQRHSADNNRGPLEKTLLLAEANDLGISLGPQVQNEMQFVRAQDHSGDISLTIKPAEKPETNILRIIRSGKPQLEIPLDYNSGSRHLAYALSPDGEKIASSGANGFLTLYSTSSGQATSSCVGHTSDIWAVAFSPDGKTLVSGSGDQTIRLWDISPSACRNLLTVFVGTDNEWVAWTPQGYYTASAHGDKYIGWHVNQGIDQQAKFYPASTFQKQFYRPDVVSEFLNKRDINLAVRAANEKRGGEVRSQPVLGARDVLAALPPMISISSPDRNEITVSQKTFHLRAEVLSNTLPIADVKVLLNGVQISGKGGAPAGGIKRRPVELELDLEPGPNILTIMASNEKAMSEPETRKIVYRSSSDAAARSDKPKLIALAIGISKYQRKDIALKFGDADASAIKAALETQKDTNNLLFSDVDVHVLPNEKATRAAILRELDWLNKQGTQRDVRVLFLSGHGDVDATKNYFFFSHEHDPDDYDLSDVPWDLLIRKLTAAKGRAVLFVDTCHAGAVMGNHTKPDPKPLSQIIKEMQTQELGLITFAASTGTETSQELDRYGHGAFTQALMEGLLQKKADLNHDGVIETDELGTWLSQRIRELTGGNQHADYEPMPGIPPFPLFQVQQ